MLAGDEAAPFGDAVLARHLGDVEGEPARLLRAGGPHQDLLTLDVLADKTVDSGEAH